VFKINTEQPHSFFIPYDKAGDSLTQTLNGTWDFKLYKIDNDIPKEFYKKSYDKSDWDKIPVPSNWQFHTEDFPVYTNIIYPYEINSYKDFLLISSLEIRVFRKLRSEQKINEIIEDAENTVQENTSLYGYTRLVNDEFNYEDKLMLLRNLWRIAYADGYLDKYEEHLIRKISDLIHVSHSDFINIKLEIRKS